MGNGLGSAPPQIPGGVAGAALAGQPSPAAAQAEMMGAHHFELLDADGVNHVYRTMPHPAIGEHSGQQIMYRLMAMASEPVTGAIGAFVGGNAAGIDPGGLSAAGRGLRDSILLQTPGELVRDVLRYTWRDGTLLGQPGALGDLAYNQAYTRNYWEAHQAAAKVIAFNRFFPLLDMLEEKALAWWATQQQPSQPSSTTGSPADTTTGSGA